MTISERRRKRRRLYELIAMMHSGPLGFDLIQQAHSLAINLFAIDNFTVPVSKPTASMYYEYQHTCVGNKELQCMPGSVQECLIEKFLHLSRSASKGADKRRLVEAEFIYDDLLVCLDTKLKSTKAKAYQELIIFSQEIITADAKYNIKFQCPDK